MFCLESKPASAVPGDTLRELTCATIDVDGRRWPAGTSYRPLSAGHDNTTGARLDYVLVSIGTEVVRFARSSVLLAMLIAACATAAAHAQDADAPAAVAPVEPGSIEDRALDAAVAAHMHEADVLHGNTPEVRARCHAPQPDAPLRAARPWARANWAAITFVSTHCRFLDQRERAFERIAGHRPSEWEFECEAGEGARPAGATTKLVEQWVGKFGDLPEPDQTWASWDVAWWPALARTPAQAKQCKEIERAWAVLNAAIAQETARLTAAAQ